MSWRQTTCVEVTCDECGGGWHDDIYAGTPHFPDWVTAADALADADWTLAGQTVVCRACTAMRACKRAGHEWTGWRAAGPFEGPQGAWKGRIRHCGRCSEGEWDPPLPAPVPSAEPQAGVR